MDNDDDGNGHDDDGNGDDDGSDSGSGGRVQWGQSGRLKLSNLNRIIVVLDKYRGQVSGPQTIAKRQL